MKDCRVLDKQSNNVLDKEKIQTDVTVLMAVISTIERVSFVPIL